MTSRSCSILDARSSPPECCRRSNKPASEPLQPRPYMGAVVRQQRRRALKNPGSGRARGLLTLKSRSISGRQPADDEFDPIAGELAPGFDLGHISCFGEALAPFARLGARFVTRQAKGLPPPGVLSPRCGRTPAAPTDDALGEIDWLLGSGRHPGPLRAIG